MEKGMQIKVLDLYEWLVFSDSQKGYFCKFYPLFTSGLAGGYKKNVLLKDLDSQPFTSFSKLLEKGGNLNYLSNEYYKAAVQYGKDFIKKTLKILLKISQIK